MSTIYVIEVKDAETGEWRYATPYFFYEDETEALDAAIKITSIRHIKGARVTQYTGDGK